MGEAYPKSVDVCNFSSSREQFERMLSMLREDQSLHMPEDAVERMVEVEGRELNRRLLQDHLRLRATAEARLKLVESADGVIHPEVRPLERQLCSLFGGVTVWRLAYQSPGCICLCPMDGQLNLPTGLHSYGLRRLVALLSAKESYDQIVDDIKDRTGIVVHKRQAEQIAIASAADFESFYDQVSFGPDTVSPTARVVLCFDGKGVVVRQQDLREVTRNKAIKAKHKLKKRLAKGEKPNRKRMAEVAVIYTVEPFVRDAQDVIRELRPAREVKERRPRPTNKRVWASVEQDMAEVIEEGFRYARTLDPELQRQWVVLVDGNDDQIRAVRNAIAKHNVPVVMVVDLMHVLEYLWKASYCFHADGTEQAETWVTDRLRGLLTGQDPSQIAAGMRRSATLRGLSKKDRKAVDDCARYLIRKRKLLDYATALQQGYPISTGVVEGACRHLIGRRMDVGGAPWSLPGAEAIVKLRALWMTGDFDDYWTYHLEQERQRNHGSRYPDARIPDPIPPMPSKRPQLRRIK
jgi:hypothetical protein